MNTPKYLEIAELIRIDIFVKYTKANQLIPSIRRYAQIYNVNPNTVSRAFRLLEADSIIYPYRTRGYYVSENIQKKKEEYGRKCAKQMLNVLQRLGYSDVEIENMINAHIMDGVAVTRFIYWLKHNVSKEKMTEISVSYTHLRAHET